MGHSQTKPINLEVVTRGLELTRSDSGQRYFTGYALTFYDGTPATVYKPLPNVEERIARGSVDLEALSETDVEIWYNHSPDFVLGSVKRNSLFLQVDQKGLHFTLPYDEADVDHQKVASKLAKGIATGCSWQAMATAKLQRDGDNYVRTITKIDNLREISIVNYPAYKSAQVSLRSEIDNFNRTQQFLTRAALL